MSRAAFSIWLILWALASPAFSSDITKASLVGYWYSENVDAEKGFVYQSLAHVQEDGYLITRFRGKRSDLAGRILDYTVNSKWSAVESRYLLELLEFNINESGVEPSSGALSGTDEYMIVELDSRRFFTKTKDGVMFRARRVNADFKLPDLPAPPFASKSHEPDRTKFDAYMRWK